MCIVLISWNELFRAIIYNIYVLMLKIIHLIIKKSLFHVKKKWINEHENCGSDNKIAENKSRLGVKNNNALHSNLLFTLF